MRWKLRRTAVKREYKQRLFNNTFKQVLWYYFLTGVKSTIRSVPKALSAFVLFITYFVIWSNREYCFKSDLPFTAINNLSLTIYSVFIICGFVLCFGIMMILFGTPSHAKRFHEIGRAHA